MASSLPIPARHKASASPPSSAAQASSSWSSSLSSSYSSPVGSSSSSAASPYSRPTTSSSSSKGKQSVHAVSMSPPSPSRWLDTPSPRRPSLLGSSLSKSEHIVINLAHSDGPPRLVTCVKSSQGFDWNQELFLPSYVNYDSSDLEHKPDPITDVILSDEEAAALLPQ